MFKQKISLLNQVVWALVARSSFQGRIREILGSIPRGNNTWPVRMSLRMSQISHPPLVGQKPVRKPKKQKVYSRWSKRGMSPLPYGRKGATVAASTKERQGDEKWWWWEEEEACVKQKQKCVAFFFIKQFFLKSFNPNP